MLIIFMKIIKKNVVDLLYKTKTDNEMFNKAVNAYVADDKKIWAICQSMQRK